MEKDHEEMTFDLVLEIAVRIFQGGLMAWLWRMGGKIDKNYRRIIAPVLVFIVTRNIGAALILAYVSRQPITGIGDTLKTDGQLFWWVPFLCFLHAIPLLIVAGIWPAVVMFFLQYLMILGSNLINLPTWNWYEKIYGFSLGAFLR